MCSYRIEDDNSIKQANATDFQPGQVSLGHMLYNLPVSNRGGVSSILTLRQALSIFSLILNDAVALTDKHLEVVVQITPPPSLRLIRLASRL